MQFDRGQARANPQRLSVRVSSVPHAAGTTAQHLVLVCRGSRADARVLGFAGHRQTTSEWLSASIVEPTSVFACLRSAQTTLNADAFWRATARGACSSTVGTSALRGRCASCARASSRNVWSTHCSIILRRLLLASRAFSTGSVGSDACRAPRTGLAHARAPRTGNGGDLPGTCCLP